MTAFSTGDMQIGESPDWSPVAPKLTAERLQKADYAGYQRLEADRQNRLSHVKYWLGNWYSDSQPGAARPINLMAQMMMAFGVQISPTDFRARLRPRRAGLAGETKMLNALIDNAMAEQNAAEDIFGMATLDALLSPFATIYTGLSPGREVVAIDGADIDPGEPFSQFIEFDDVSVDPNAKDLRRALWFRHRMRVPRHWLLQSPAFADSHDLIMRLPAVENGVMFDDLSSIEDLSHGDQGTRDEDALFETVELLNVIIYEHGRMIECCLPPHNKGPAQFLRREEWVGPDRGPYDWLSFWRVPGNLTSLSPASIVRDVAEKGDRLFNKITEQAERSKKNLVYKRGAEEDAAAMAEAADGDSIGVDDPSQVVVNDMQMVAERLVTVLGVINQGYQDLAGNPALLSGSAEQANTLGQDQILNMRAGARVSYMSRHVVNLIRRVVQKWAFYFQTDNSIQREVPVSMPGIGETMLRYDAMTRKGGPADYRYDVRLIAQPNSDPNVQAERAQMFMNTIIQMAPSFMPNPAMPGVPPLFKLRGVVEELAPKFGIENPEDIINDIELELERLMAEQGADAWLARAAQQAPDLAGPGTHSAPSPNPMAAPTGLPAMPSGVTGTIPRPMNGASPKPRR